jgi:tmRNA-binding protein
VPADGTHSVSLNFTLLRDNPELWSSRYDYGLKENLVSGKYLNNTEVKQVMAALERLNPSIAELQTSSNMVEQSITSLKLTHEVCNRSHNNLSQQSLSERNVSVVPNGCNRDYV